MSRRFFCIFYTWTFLQLICLTSISDLKLSRRYNECFSEIKNVPKLYLFSIKNEALIRLLSTKYKLNLSKKNETDAKKLPLLSHEFIILKELDIFNLILNQKRHSRSETNDNNLSCHFREAKLNGTMRSIFYFDSEKLKNKNKINRGNCSTRVILNNLIEKLLKVHLKRSKNFTEKNTGRDCDSDAPTFKKKKNHAHGFNFPRENNLPKPAVYERKMFKKTLAVPDVNKIGELFFQNATQESNHSINHPNVIGKLNQNELAQKRNAEFQDFILPEDSDVSFFQSINEDLQSDLFPLNRMKNRIAYPMEKNDFDSELEIDHQIAENFDKITETLGEKHTRKLESQFESELSPLARLPEINGKEPKTIKIRQDSEDPHIKGSVTNFADSDNATRLIEKDATSTPIGSEKLTSVQRYEVTDKLKSLKEKIVNSLETLASESLKKENNQKSKLVKENFQNPKKANEKFPNSVNHFEKQQFLPKLQNTNPSKDHKFREKNKVTSHHKAFKISPRSNYHNGGARENLETTEVKKLSKPTNNKQGSMEKRFSKNKFENIVTSVKEMFKNPKSIFDKKHPTTDTERELKLCVHKCDDNIKPNEKKITIKYIVPDKEESAKTNHAMDDSLRKKVLKFLSLKNVDDSKRTAKIVSSLDKKRMGGYEKLNNENEYLYKKNSRRLFKSKNKSHIICKKHTRNKLLLEKKYTKKNKLKSKSTFSALETKKPLKLRKKNDDVKNKEKYLKAISKKGGFHRKQDKSSAYYYDYYNYEDPEIFFDDSKEFSRLKIRPTIRKLQSADDFEQNNDDSNFNNEKKDYKKKNFINNQTNKFQSNMFNLNNSSCEVKVKPFLEKLVSNINILPTNTSCFGNNSVTDYYKSGFPNENNHAVKFFKRSLKSFEPPEVISNEDNFDEVVETSIPDSETIQKVRTSNQKVEKELEKIFPPDENQNALINDQIDSYSDLQKEKFSPTKNDCSDQKKVLESDEKIRVKRYRTDDMTKRDESYSAGQQTNQLQNPFKGVSSYLRDRFNNIKGKACRNRLHAKLIPMTTDSSGECPQCLCEPTESAPEEPSEPILPLEENTTSAEPEENTESGPLEENIETNAPEENTSSAEPEENTEKNEPEENTESGVLEESNTPEEPSSSEESESESPGEEEEKPIEEPETSANPEDSEIEMIDTSTTEETVDTEESTVISTESSNEESETESEADEVTPEVTPEATPEIETDENENQTEEPEEIDESETSEPETIESPPQSDELPDSDVDTEEPEKDTEEPEKDTEEPEKDTEEPEKDTEEPEENTEEPEKDTEEPEKDTEEPEENTEEPEEKPGTTISSETQFSVWQGLLRGIKNLEKKIMEKKKNPEEHHEIGDTGVEIEYEKIHIKPKGTSLPEFTHHRRRLTPMVRLDQKKLGSNFEWELDRVGKVKNFHHEDREIMKTYLENPLRNDRSRARQDKHLEQEGSKQNHEIASGDQQSEVHRRRPRRRKLVDITNRRRRPAFERK